VLEPASVNDVGTTPARIDVRLPLSKLQHGFVDLPSRDAEIAYASAAMAVRRLMDERGMGPLVALLQDLPRGASFPLAFQRRMGMRYEKFATVIARR
jgi:hypothetical protein